MNKREWHPALARMLLHASLGFEMWYSNSSVAYLRSTGKSAEHKVRDSRFRRGINEVYTLLVFSQKGFPKIGDAENARAASQYRLEAGWIITYAGRNRLKFSPRTSRATAQMAKVHGNTFLSTLRC